MARHWKKLPKDVVYVPSLETFKVWLNSPLSNLILLSLLIAGKLDWMAFKGHPMQVTLCLYLVTLLFFSGRLPFKDSVFLFICNASDTLQHNLNYHSPWPKYQLVFLILTRHRPFLHTSSLPGQSTEQKQ